MANRKAKGGLNVGVGVLGVRFGPSLAVAAVHGDRPLLCEDGNTLDFSYGFGIRSLNNFHQR